MVEARPISLPYLMAGLSRVSFSGQLGMLEGDVERTILFHNGSPTHVRSWLQEETLGRILLDEGRLSPEQYDQLLAAMVDSRRPAGEILVSMGVLGPQDVFSALEFQIRKKLINAFRMVNFQYAIQEEPVAPEMLIANVDATEAILSGLLTCYTVDRMLDEFPVDEETVFTARARDQRVSARIGAKETRLLRTLDHPTALAKLMAGGTDLRYLLSVLYTFHSLGLVEAAGLTRPRCEELDLLMAKAGLLESAGAPVRPQRPAPRPAPQPAPKPKPAPPPVAEEPEEEEEEFRPPTLAIIMQGRVDDKLAEKVLSLSRADHFSLLDLDRDADETAVRLAYQQLLNSFGLDDIEGTYATEKERELAERLLDQATIAYRELSQDDSRQAYLSALKSKLAQGEREIPPRILADVAAHKADLAIRGRRWSEARKLLEEAIELYPKEPSYHYQLGKLGFTQAMENTPADQPLPDGLRKPFLKALALDPRYDLPRIHLGYLAKRNGNLKLAIREFKGALEVNPQNKVAQSELRLLKRRVRLQKD